MKRIQYGMYGGPELMRLDEFELATPGQGQVAVKVKFAAINPIDWKLRNGQMKIVTGRAFPRAMGFDFSGTVISVGPGVTRFVPGDAVFGLARFKESGALGEAVIANETALAVKPGNVSFEDAACLGTPGVTAWNGLVDKAKLTAGQHVFINGCTGAVGEAAVQIARMHGAIVSGSCSAGAMERARALGLAERLRLSDNGPVQAARAFRRRLRHGRHDDDRPRLGPAARGWRVPGPRSHAGQVHPFGLQPAAETDRLHAAARHSRQPRPCRGEGRFRMPIAEIVPLNEAIGLVTALEAGRKLGGKGLVAMA